MGMGKDSMSVYVGKVCLFEIKTCSFERVSSVRVHLSRCALLVKAQVF